MSVRLPSLPERPLVSVVTPSYNQSSFLEETVRSVFRQDYPAIEHWVIDGGSDDGTVELLAGLEEQTSAADHYRLRWISEPDAGQAHAVNKGFERVSGQVVGWLNSDDVYFCRHALTRIVDAFRQGNASVVYGNCAVIGPGSRLLRVDRKLPFSRERLLRGCFICQPALFLRAEVVREHRLRRDLDYVMDYEFWLRLSRAHRFSHLDTIVAADRNHEERKILRDRDAMVDEREKLQSEYGLNWGLRQRAGWVLDKILAGSNRLRGVLDVLAISRRQDLTFDAAVPSLTAGLFRQLFRKNRSLT